ncbi:MAG: polysaccharide biosynthesis C-terminal domain-containing protein [Lentimicrobiaceae bacterium]
MIRNLLSTTASRMLIAIINLAIVWMSARYLGASAMGSISLIILGISIIQIITAVLAGSSIVYQASRHPVADLLTIAWLWILIAGIPVWLFLSLADLIPREFTFDVLILSILGGIITVNQNVLLGKERVNAYNGMAVLQSIMVLLSLFLLLVAGKWMDVRAYVTAQYISMGSCAMIGTLMILPPIKSFRIPTMALVKEAAGFGGYLQAASLMQLFNYRLSYYIIEKYFDRATLGVFSVGVQIAESVWIVAKSMAVLQYSRISNSRNHPYSIRLTVNFLKFTGLVTSILIGIILLLPQEFFVWIFRSDFSHITQVIASLSVGILALALSLMFSHYFSGTGQPVHNTISSGIGLIFTVILGFTLIPRFGLTGAGITASLSYLAGMLYQLLVFKKTTRVMWMDFVPAKKDVLLMTSEIKEMLKTERS